jgi:LasA protease
MKTLKVILLLALASFACNFPLSQAPINQTNPYIPPQQIPSPVSANTATPNIPIPTPEINLLEQPMSYLSQPGDTLPNVAGRFHVALADIYALNSGLQTQTVNPFFVPGTSIRMDISANPGWNPAPTLFPNYLFVYSPSEAGFNTYEYVNHTNGWLKRYVDNSSGNHVTGVQIVNDIALNYSISPRLILALLEYKLHAISDPTTPASYSLGNIDEKRKPFTNQISWMANILNNGFYCWQDGKILSLSDASLDLNPWQNAATFGLSYYFSQIKPSPFSDPFSGSIKEFMSVYQDLFGPVDLNSKQNFDLLPPGLSQPNLILPFNPNEKNWSYTGGPHSGWGIGDPLAAVDFAPPAETSGCEPSPEWALAAADGIITRSDDGFVFLDLDGDGNQHTGWVMQYMHLFPESVPGPGTHLKQGDPIGHPSCIGGHATGRHVHIARLYNGVWISASTVLPLNLSGWVAVPGDKEYNGLLIRDNIQVRSSIYGEHESRIPADPLK